VEASSACPASRPTVDVIDLRTGNIGSVIRILERIGAEPRVVTEPADVAGPSPKVLPGVGNFGHAAASMDASGMRQALGEVRFRGIPVLGICLGAQLMCRGSEESPGRGLGWFRADVRRFPRAAAGGASLRVPHMGWRPVDPGACGFPWEQPRGRMYYAHSYYIQPDQPGEAVAMEEAYGGVRFAAAVRDGAVIGVQFHPEKSHVHGMGFLREWLRWAGEGRP
jgi:glutamine amidotransferase